MKAKRASVANMFAAARKESSLLLAPQLVLKQCVSQAAQGTGKTTTKIAEHVLQLPGSAAAKSSAAGARETPHLSASTVVNLFGGPVLNINTLNAKEAEAVLTAAALAKRQAEASAAAAAAADGKPRGPAGPPQPALDVEDDGSRMIDDIEATTRELRAAQPPSASKQISSFYTLVSAKWLKQKLAQEAAAAANALAAKDKTQKKGKKAVPGAAESTAHTEEAGDHGAESALQLIAVGPAMQHAEMVRWDFQRNLCALVLSGSSAINILRLEVTSTDEDGGYSHLDLHTLLSVDFCVPSSIRISPLCGLTWADGVLFATEESAASIRAVYCYKPVNPKVPSSYPTIHAADVLDLPNFSPVSYCPFSVSLLADRTEGIFFCYNCCLIESHPDLLSVSERLPRCLAGQQVQLGARREPRACVRGAGSAAGPALHGLQVSRPRTHFYAMVFCDNVSFAYNLLNVLLLLGMGLSLECRYRPAPSSPQCSSTIYLFPALLLLRKLACPYLRPYRHRLDGWRHFVSRTGLSLHKVKLVFVRSQQTLVFTQ